jgi:hypothetical protein
MRNRFDHLANARRVRRCPISATAARSNCLPDSALRETVCSAVGGEIAAPAIARIGLRRTQSKLALRERASAANRPVARGEPLTRCRTDA